MLIYYFPFELLTSLLIIMTERQPWDELTQTSSLSLLFETLKNLLISKLKSMEFLLRK